MRREVLLDRQRLGQRRRRDPRGLIRTAGHRRRRRTARHRDRRRWRHPAARPRSERGALGADSHPHLSGRALDLIVLQRVEVDHDANDVGLELRVAHVAHAAAILAVVQRHGPRETRALEVDHEARGIRKSEVLDDRGPQHVDDDLDLARGRQHAHTSHLSVPPAHRRPRKGPGNNDGEQERKAT